METADSAIGLVVFVVFVFTFFVIIILAFSTVGEDKGNKKSNHSSARKTKRKTSNRRTAFDRDSNRYMNSSRQSGNPFDNYWESSFDWKDDNNDGYDDRDDGFWNEREF